VGRASRRIKSPSLEQSHDEREDDDGSCWCGPERHDAGAGGANWKVEKSQKLL